MNLIETEKLTKYYGKERGILNLDLQVEEGEIFGFIGPNGSGKSTTIRTLLGLIFPTSGSGRIFGWDIVKDSKKIKGNIGFMPSDVHYYDRMDVSELLNYSAAFYGVKNEQRIAELAEIFSLDLKRRLVDLSMGNKKKVAILQALVHKPKLLILDEPTSGLDPLMQSRFFEILQEKNRDGTTIFFSSHTLSEVQKMCGRVAIIKEGQILNVENIETLRKRQLRKIEIEFAVPVKADEITCGGIITARADGNLLKFLYSGRMNDLLKILAEKNVIDFIIEEPSLEEIFIHYYSDTASSSDNGGAL